MEENYLGGHAIMRQTFELRGIPQESTEIMIESLSVPSRT